MIFNSSCTNQKYDDLVLPYDVTARLVNQRNHRDITIFLAIIYNMDSEGNYVFCKRSLWVFNRITPTQFDSGVKRLERAGFIHIEQHPLRGFTWVTVVDAHRFMKGESDV